MSCNLVRQEATRSPVLPLAEPRLVLLVDDDASSALGLARLLRPDGFDVEIARDGAAAIARLARLPLPDALVTELQLPYVDGTAICRYGRSQRADLPVFIVTSHANGWARPDLGAPEPVLISKPVDYAALRDALLRATEPAG